MQGARPSATARRVAAHRLAFDRVPAGTGRPEDDDRLARDVAGDEAVDHEGMHRYLGMRTAFFDRVVVDAIDGGCRQVVLLGAGYDGRALRYERDGVTFFEVDLPATQADKRARLARLGIDDAAVRYVPCDFATDDVASLLAAAQLTAAKAAFLLEGVLPYLAAPVVESLLHALARAAGPSSMLAVSAGVVLDDADAAARSARFREAVAKLGEPVRSDLDHGGFTAMLERAGFVVLGGDGEADARRRRLGFVVATRPGD